mgnify:CR=1 FL=1
MRRVVLTGQGAICALGRSAPEIMAAMREGRSGIGPLEFQDADRLSISIGGQIRGYVPEEHFSRQELVLYDLFTQLALHEMHHRAQIMAMLRESGAAILEDLDYNALMYQRVEATA